MRHGAMDIERIKEMADKSCECAACSTRKELARELLWYRKLNGELTQEIEALRDVAQEARIFLQRMDSVINQPGR